MLKRRIIPRITIRDGRIVKGVHFKGIRDPSDPIEAARAYDQQGADELCFVDDSIDAEGRRTFVRLMERVTRQLFLPTIAGGGIQSEADARILLEAGIDRVALNTAALTYPPLLGRLVERFGSHSILSVVSARRMEPRAGDAQPIYEAVIHGRSRGTGVEVFNWCEQLVRLGATELAIHAVDREQSRDGFDVWLTREVARRLQIPVIASGGVGSLEHLCDVLDDAGGGADGAFASSIFHFGLFTIGQAKRYLAQRDIPVRPPASAV